MKVAAVQLKPLFKKYGPNVEDMMGWTRAAAKAGAELIVLPELATTGYSFTSKEEAALYSEDLSDLGATQSVTIMTQLAQELNVAIAWGFLEREADAYYNAQCLVMPGGGRTSYRKRNLWGSDFLWATPGDRNPGVVSWRGKQIGLLICRDIRDKDDDGESLYEPGDAEIVAFSSNFGAGAVPAVSWVTFAKSNKVHLIVSNRFGDEYGDEAYHDFGNGGILVIRPDGSCVRDGYKLGKPCMVLADV